MALNQKQVFILAGGGVVAYFLLKKPKPGQPPNALQKLLNPGASAAPLRPSATAMGAQGGYYGGGTTGGTPRPTTTNLATQYGAATRPQTPSLQGFGANPVASLIGGFANLAGSILRGVTGQAPRPATTAPAGTAARPSSSSGGSSGGGGASSGSGASRPGASTSAQQGFNEFGGRTTYSSTYNPDDFKGINPNTGLYDPDYDPSVLNAGYFDPVTGAFVTGDAPLPADYSQLPGYGLGLPVLDENGAVDPNAAPAQGADTGTSTYQTVNGGVSGPDDAGYYYNPDGSIAWGYGEAPIAPDASWDNYNDDPLQAIGGGGDFSELPGYGTELPQVEPIAETGAGIDPTTWDAPVDDSFASANDFSALPGYGTDIGGGGGGGDYSDYPDESGFW
jgi:hypothetical protein